MRECAVALVLCGCGFSSEATSSDASVEIDGSVSIDAMTIDTMAIDARPDPYCAGTLNRVCVDPPPSAAVTLPAGTLDTGNSLLCAVYTSTPAVTACVIAGTSITLPAGVKLTVFGSKPLILLADTVRIAGTLDAASHRGAANGPGADLGPCATNVTNPDVGNGHADGGGGWGGSFGGKGGDGGNGGEDGSAGKAGDVVAAANLRAGCPGGDGAGTGGGKGHGGGAVSLIAKQQILIDGVVDASGSAGSGAQTSGGGGGGGSGGMIVLDASTVTVTGQCYANGGGGGEGANAMKDGATGHEPGAPNVVAAGGAGSTDVGGDGGNGGFGAVSIGTVGLPGGNLGGNAVGGGGGGGGGAGVIKLFSTLHNGTDDITKVAPPPS